MENSWNDIKRLRITFEARLSLDWRPYRCPPRTGLIGATDALPRRAFDLLTGAGRLLLPSGRPRLAATALTADIFNVPAPSGPPQPAMSRDSSTTVAAAQPHNRIVLVGFFTMDS